MAESFEGGLASWAVEVQAGVLVVLPVLLEFFRGVSRDYECSATVWALDFIHHKSSSKTSERKVCLVSVEKS